MSDYRGRLRRFCAWRHHNIRWGRKWEGRDASVNPGDPDTTVVLQWCLCRHVYHIVGGQF